MLEHPLAERELTSNLHVQQSQKHRHYDPKTGTWFEHAHAHGVHHLSVNLPVLEKNDRLAERNRGFFLAHRTVVLNLMSSPGAGKTSLLEKTLDSFASCLRCAVLVGDLATDIDGRRLDNRGAQVLQITTGTACHLNAEMVSVALGKLNWEGLEFLFIENVGNLVCPATFDLGENYRIVLFAVTEGEDKPLKYPPLFHKADVVLITKMDLASHVGFDLERARENLRLASPDAKIFEISVRSGHGLDSWLQWLETIRP
ncbi:MAG: hydrogenase nickel incorporation protein HypB [Chthoniobacterales bacterium]|nr:hydrogenase nickel incorporation protein HypB [Chthoniobacterales bacterium]